MHTDSSKPPVIAPFHRLPALWLAILLAAGIHFEKLISPSMVLVAVCWLSAILGLALAAQFRTAMGPLQRLAAITAIMLTGALVSSLFNGTLEIKRQFAASGHGRVAVQGYVSGPPRRLNSRYGWPERLEFDLDVTTEKRNRDSAWQQASYRLNVTVTNPGELKISGGCRLAFSAELLPFDGYANPGGFDWRDYWGRRFVAGRAMVDNGRHVRLLDRGDWQGFVPPDVRYLAAALQARLLAIHEQLYPDPHIRAVAGAILLGDRRGLDRRTRSWFARSGTIHVLVVSGLHLGFIAGAVYLLVAFALGRGYASATLTSVVLLVYALATGGRPPVVRAWLLVSFAMFALPAGRQRVLLNSLAAAFVILLLINPSWLFDAGFQLSFAAVAGICLAMPFVEANFSRRDWWRSRIRRWAFRLVAVSAVAQLAVAPLLAWHFGQLSPAAFVANPPVVCLAGICVIGGFAAGMAGLLWLGAGKLIAAGVAYPLAAMSAVAHWFSDFEWSSFPVPSPGISGVICCWLALLLAAGLIGGERKYAGRLVLVLLLWLNVALWAPVLAAMRPRTEVTFLDLGEATAPVVCFPGGAMLLADQAGRSGRGYWVAGELIGPYLDRVSSGRLDYLLLRGKTNWSWVSRILRDYSPSLVLVAGSRLPDETASRLEDYCDGHGIALRLATADDTLFSGGARVYFTGRDTLPVVEYGGRRVLLAGGSDLPPDNDMVRSYSVVETTRQLRPGGEILPWLVTPLRLDWPEEKLVETSRSGAAKFLLTGKGIKVDTEREGRRSGRANDQI